MPKSNPDTVQRQAKKKPSTADTGPDATHQEGSPMSTSSIAAGTRTAKTRAAIYTRVSTAKQVQEGYSLGEQDYRCREHIEREGWEMVEAFEEAGVSGKLRSRPELDRLLGSLSDLDVVVISSLDRFGRSTKNLLELFDTFAQANVALVFLRERIDTSTPVGRLMRTVLAALAEFERDLIASRTRTGLEARAKTGQAMGALPGIGYRVDGEGKNTQRVVDDSTRHTVIEIFERIAKGETPGAVGRWLNSQGIKTQRDTPFTQRSIRKIVANNAYQGEKGYPRIVTDELAAEGP